MGGLLQLVQRGGDWAGLQPAQSPPRSRSKTVFLTQLCPIRILMNFNAFQKIPKFMNFMNFKTKSGEFLLYILNVIDIL